MWKRVGKGVLLWSLGTELWLTDDFVEKWSCVLLLHSPRQRIRPTSVGFRGT